MTDDPLDAELETFLRAAEPAIKISFVALLLDRLDAELRTSPAPTVEQMRDHARGLLQAAAAGLRKFALEVHAHPETPDDDPTSRP